MLPDAASETSSALSLMNQSSTFWVDASLIERMIQKTEKFLMKSEISIKRL